jgi:hypothetical protein
MPKARCKKRPSASYVRHRCSMPQTASSAGYLEHAAANPYPLELSTMYAKGTLNLDARCANSN